jgi:hypothetical protein
MAGKAKLTIKPITTNPVVASGLSESRPTVN